MERSFNRLIENSIKEHWNMPAFSEYDGDTFSYGDVAEKILKLHIIFREAGIEKGDRIALIGRNSSFWGISFFAVLSYGAVVVPLLHEFTPDNVHNLVNHSGAKILLAGTYSLKSLDIQQMPDIEQLIVTDDFSIEKGSDKIKAVNADIDEIFKKEYPDFSPDDIHFHADEPEETAIINYTSGTTGFSKGVILPYRAVWSNIKFIMDYLPNIKAGDDIVSMLPMAHMYGLAIEIIQAFAKGCHIHFLPRVPSPNIIIKAFGDIKPTLIIAVPLILEKVVRSRVFPALKKQPVKFLHLWPGFRQMINRKICKQLTAAFGGKFYEVIIGGAALNKEIETFLYEIGFRFTVGYGMTECAPLISYEHYEKFKIGAVGRIVDRMEARIYNPNAEGIGEVVVRGANTALGYYKNPEATTNLFTEDGWLRTGDLGFIDGDGYLFLKGRNKTMLLGANGQNIYPEEIESELNNMPYVAESLIVSRTDKDNKHILIALVYPSFEQAKQDGLSDDDLRKIIEHNVTALNKKMPFYCKITSVEIQKEEFRKTPKQSIKRYLYQE